MAPVPVPAANNGDTNEEPCNEAACTCILYEDQFRRFGFIQVVRGHQSPDKLVVA